MVIEFMQDRVLCVCEQQVKDIQIKSESFISTLNKDHLHLTGEQALQSQRAHLSRSTKIPIHRQRRMCLYILPLPLFLYYS